MAFTCCCLVILNLNLNIEKVNKLWTCEFCDVSKLASSISLFCHSSPAFVFCSSYSVPSSALAGYTPFNPFLPLALFNYFDLFQLIWCKTWSSSCTLSRCNASLPVRGIDSVMSAWPLLRAPW